MAEAFGADLGQQGQLQSFFWAGGIVGLLVSGYVTERIGAGRSGMISVGLVGLGAVLLGVAATYWQVLSAAAVIGLGNASILAAYSAVITSRFADVRQRMFMFATAVFAGSATLSTALVGDLLEAGSHWQQIFLGLACLVAVSFVPFFVIARRKLAAAEQASAAAENGSPNKPTSLAAQLRRARAFLTEGLFDRAAFWLLAVLVILDIIAAGNIIAWTARFIEIEYDVGTARAGRVLSASSAGVFFGRLIMGAFVSGRIGDRLLLGICYAAGILAYALILVIPGYRLALVLVFLNGAFIAAQAPTMYAIASAKFGARAPTAIPLIDAIGMLGGFTTPALVGAFADHYGLDTVLWFIPVVGMILVAIVFAWEFADRRQVRNATDDH